MPSSSEPLLPDSVPTKHYFKFFSNPERNNGYHGEAVPVEAATPQEMRPITGMQRFRIRGNHYRGKAMIVIMASTEILATGGVSAWRFIADSSRSAVTQIVPGGAGINDAASIVSEQTYSILGSPTLANSFGNITATAVQNYESLEGLSLRQFMFGTGVALIGATACFTWLTNDPLKPCEYRLADSVGWEEDGTRFAKLGDYKFKIASDSPSRLDVTSDDDSVVATHIGASSDVGDSDERSSSSGSALPAALLVGMGHDGDDDLDSSSGRAPGVASAAALTSVVGEGDLGGDLDNSSEMPSDVAEAATLVSFQHRQQEDEVSLDESTAPVSHQPPSPHRWEYSMFAAITGVKRNLKKQREERDPEITTRIARDDQAAIKLGYVDEQPSLLSSAVATLNNLH